MRNRGTKVPCLRTSQRENLDFKVQVLSPQGGGPPLKVFAGCRRSSPTLGPLWSPSFLFSLLAVALCPHGGGVPPVRDLAGKDPYGGQGAFGPLLLVFYPSLLVRRGWSCYKKGV